MTKSRVYKSDLSAAIHETAEGLYDIGLIDKKTMRKFDSSCLAEMPDLAAEDIKAIREHEDVSQSVFALYLNVPKSLVSQWERGEKKPSGPSLKLLSLVQRKGLSALM